MHAPALSSPCGGIMMALHLLPLAKTALSKCGHAVECCGHPLPHAVRCWRCWLARTQAES